MVAANWTIQISGSLLQRDVWWGAAALSTACFTCGVTRRITTTGNGVVTQTGAGGTSSPTSPVKSRTLPAHQTCSKNNYNEQHPICRTTQHDPLIVAGPRTSRTPSTRRTRHMERGGRYLCLTCNSPPRWPRPGCRQPARWGFPSGTSTLATSPGSPPCRCRQVGADSKDNPKKWENRVKLGRAGRSHVIINIDRRTSCAASG